MPGRRGRSWLGFQTHPRKFPERGAGGWAGAPPLSGLLGLPHGQRDCRTAPCVLCPGPQRPHRPGCPQPSSARSLSQRIFTRCPAVPSHRPAPRRPPGRAHPRPPLPSSLISAHPSPHLPALPAPSCTQPHTSTESSAIPAQPPPALHFPLQPLGAVGIQVPRCKGGPTRGGPAPTGRRPCFYALQRRLLTGTVLSPRFSGESSVAQRGQALSQGHTAARGRGEDSQAWGFPRPLITPPRPAVASFTSGPWRPAPRRRSASWPGEL